MKTTQIKIGKSSVSGSKVKEDFKKISVAISKAIAMGIGGKPFSALKEAISIIDGFSLEKKPENLLYKLFLSSMLNSAHDLCEENLDKFDESLKNNEKLYDAKVYVEFLDGIEKLLIDEELVIDYSNLTNPRSISFLNKFQDFFQKWLVKLGMEQVDSIQVSSRLKTYFIYNLNDNWKKNYDSYNDVVNHLFTPVHQAVKSEIEWESYRALLQKEVELSLFGEAFGLKSVFIPLRCYYSQMENGEDVHNLIWADNYLNEWVSDQEVENDFVIIHGDPGAGKTSFMKSWAAEKTKDNNVRILFFSLNRFEIQSDIQSAIGNYLELNPSIPFSKNPLLDKNIHEETILIFDGLDEYLLLGKAAKESAISFVEKLKEFLLVQNEGKRKFKVVITGRPIAVQNTMKHFRSEKNVVLYLLPYDLHYWNHSNQLKFHDPQKLEKINQKKDWWKKYCELKKIPYTDPSKFLQTEWIDDITDSPLLNYLVALLYFDSPSLLNNELSFTDIYHLVIKSAYRRQYSKSGRHKALKLLSFDEFKKILEEIAIGSWSIGDRHISMGEMKRRLKSRNLLKHLKFLENYGESTKEGRISRLLTAFYFQKTNLKKFDEEVFEFTHKSIQEYFTSCAIINLLDYSVEIIEKKNTNIEIQNLLTHWSYYLGAFQLNQQIRLFLRVELGGLNRKGKSLEPYQDVITLLLNESIENGLTFSDKKISFSEQCKIFQNTNNSLLRILAVCAYRTKKQTLFKLENRNTFGQWISKVKNSISDISFTTYDAEGGLHYIDISRSDFKFCSMSSWVLNHSNLNDCTFHYIDFHYVKLNNSLLNNCNIFASSFIEAGCTACDFSHSKIDSTNFSNSYLERAKFRHAKLSRVIFNNAKLDGADFTGATGLTFKMLVSTKSLKNVIGLDEEIYQRILKEKPSLLE